MESSDEEEDAAQKLDLEKRKSTHQLLVVIFESIRDSFKGKPDIGVYRRVMRVLSEEKQMSEELKLAMHKIRDIIRTDDELSEQDKTTIMLESKGIFTDIDIKDQEQTESLKKRLLKVLEGAKKETFVSLCHLNHQVVEFINTDREILKVLGQAIKHIELDTSIVIELLQKFNVKVVGELRNQLEQAKFDYRVVNIYLKKVLENESNFQKLKYLEEFVKKLNDPGSGVSISSINKLEVMKKVIASLVGYLKDKHNTEEGDEDEEGKYKYIGQYFRVLVSVTKLNIELLEFLGEVLVKEWLSQMTADRKFLNTVAEIFWPMKKQCPAPIFIFLLNHSSTVSPV